MGLASKIVRENLAIPGEPGEWVTLRAVSDKKLREAARSASREAMLSVKGLPDEVIKVINGASRPNAEKALEKAPEEAYDWDMLCRSAIIAWSYSDKPTPDEIGDLVTSTKRWVVRQILEMAGVTEDESKNSSSDSIST